MGIPSITVPPQAVLSPCRIHPRIFIGYPALVFEKLGVDTTSTPPEGVTKMHQNANGFGTIC
jgi:carbonic anhydrase/acetyltransferase-like protein (isoleucine patch superfamily)